MCLLYASNEHAVAWQGSKGPGLTVSQGPSVARPEGPKLETARAESGCSFGEGAVRGTS